MLRRRKWYGWDTLRTPPTSIARQTPRMNLGMAGTHTEESTNKHSQTSPEKEPTRQKETGLTMQHLEVD
jgi:hypothetical protein